LESMCCTYDRVNMQKLLRQRTHCTRYGIANLGSDKAEERMPDTMFRRLSDMRQPAFSQLHFISDAHGHMHVQENGLRRLPVGSRAASPMPGQHEQNCVAKTYSPGLHGSRATSTPPLVSQLLQTAQSQALSSPAGRRQLGRRVMPPAQTSIRGRKEAEALSVGSSPQPTLSSLTRPSTACSERSEASLYASETLLLNVASTIEGSPKHRQRHRRVSFSTDCKKRGPRSLLGILQQMDDEIL